MVKRAIEEFGRVDVLVNNVGIAPAREGFLTVSDADWQLVFETNLMSMVRTCRAVIPHMVQQKHGVIIAHKVARSVARANSRTIQ